MFRKENSVENKERNGGVRGNEEAAPANVATAPSQPTRTEESASAGAAPAAAGVKGTITKSQSISATPDQPEKTLPDEIKIEGMTSIKLGDSHLLYAEKWLSDADQWFERLKNEVLWSPETVMMYGKPLVLERQTCNFGDDYDYNVNAKPAVEWGGPVLELKKMLEEFTGRVFTQCACNLYPDGETGIGLHHDKRHPSLVASISFGAVRTMGFAPKGGKLDKSLPMVPLASGSLLLFTDVINENFKHTIVEDKSVRGPRISVTFREFAPTRQAVPISQPRRKSGARDRGREGAIHQAPL
jgi:alkylated DNA repair dioxygenase AlkB